MCFQCSISWRTTRAKQINCAVLFILLFRKMEFSECMVTRKTISCYNSCIVVFTENDFKRSVGTKRKYSQKLSHTPEASRRQYCLTKFLDVPNISLNFNSPKSQTRFPTNQCRAKVEFFTTMIKNIVVLSNMTPYTLIDKCLPSKGLCSSVLGLLSWWWGQRVLPVHWYFPTEVHVVICQMIIFHLKWHK